MTLGLHPQFYNIKDNPRQPEDTPHSHIQQKVRLMETTPTNHNKEVIYKNIKGNNHMTCAYTPPKIVT